MNKNIELELVEKNLLIKNLIKQTPFLECSEDAKLIYNYYLNNFLYIDKLKYSIYQYFDKNIIYLAKLLYNDGKIILLIKMHDKPISDVTYINIDNQEEIANILFSLYHSAVFDNTDITEKINTINKKFYNN